MTPTLKGRTSADFMGWLHRLSQSGKRCPDIIIVIDTLKKFADMNSKSEIKKMMEQERLLNALDITIINLAHTLKHRDKKGKLIFERVGYIKSDTDELIFFDPLKNEDGTMSVTTIPDKIRGTLKPITFEIGPDRNVKRIEFVDTHTMNKLNMDIAKDRGVIDLIDEANANDNRKQADITQYLEEHGSVGGRVARSVLKKHSLFVQVSDPVPPRSNGVFWHYYRTVAHEYRYGKTE